MSIVNCSRVEVVECSGLKPCLSGAGRRYLLMVGSIIVVVDPPLLHVAVEGVRQPNKLR